ncbi:hypothetical protein NECAME_13748 [Necator americanus]|uniref:Uncharacterized protein n=1 Tax=Necator americanus TaxID=51031 RepID=W2SVQ4_NECAM|nr:hypothetical protein NECAME_13748 [Necator americanus]ETN72757.1 hypothetical protein NECAME_13748 [Necator americanus]
MQEKIDIDFGRITPRMEISLKFKKKIRQIPNLALSLDTLIYDGIIREFDVIIAPILIVPFENSSHEHKEIIRKNSRTTVILEDQYVSIRGWRTKFTVQTFRGFVLSALFEDDKPAGKFEV